MGMSCERIGGGELDSMGRSRARKDSFSSSGIGLDADESSEGAQPRLTRFLRYTTAGKGLAGILTAPDLTHQRVVLRCPVRPGGYQAARWESQVDLLPITSNQFKGF